MKHKIAVLYGSMREKRQGIKAARFIMKKIGERGHEAVLIDAKEYDLPFLDKMFKEFKNDDAPEVLKKISGILTESDGFVIVSGEYNHSIPPPLKNMIDFFGREYQYKPSAIVSYSAGSFAGIRASSHLRDVITKLGMPAIPSTFPIAEIQDSIDEYGNVLKGNYERYIGNFLEEFEWYVRAFKNEREKGIPS